MVGSRRPSARSRTRSEPNRVACVSLSPARRRSTRRCTRTASPRSNPRPSSWKSSATTSSRPRHLWSDAGLIDRLHHGLGRSARPCIRSTEDLLTPVNRGLAAAARAASAADYANAVVLLQAAARRIVAFWNDFDVVLTPTLALPAGPDRLAGGGRRRTRSSSFVGTPSSRRSRRSRTSPGSRRCRCRCHMNGDGLPDRRPGDRRAGRRGAAPSARGSGRGCAPVAASAPADLVARETSSRRQACLIRIR